MIKQYHVYFFLISFFSIAFIQGDKERGYHIPPEPQSICSADIDNSNGPDLITGHGFSPITQWGGISILKNTGSGYFQIADNFTVVSGATELHTTMLDNNIYPDIFYLYETTNPQSSYAGIHLNYQVSGFTENRSFLLASGASFNKIRCGDLDNDGDQDLVFSSFDDKKWGYAMNNGLGTFSSPVISSLPFFVYDIDVGDLDGDNREDIVISGVYYGGGGTTRIFYSLQGGFQSDSLAGENDRVHIADMDHNGINDVVCLIDTWFLTGIKIFENTGNRTFIKHDQPVFDVSSYSSTLADLNNDNLPDLLVLPGSFHAVGIFYNQGNFKLKKVFEFLVPEYWDERRDIACADFDTNGFIDFALTRDLPDSLTFCNLLVFFNDGKGNFIADTLSSIKPQVVKPVLECCPNPFQDKSFVKIGVKQSGKIHLELWNDEGKLIKTLTHGFYSPGEYMFKVDGNELSLPRGIYFILLKQEEKVVIYRKIIHL